ncbi:MAG: glycosyltransferase family 4 protein [bacterium]
MSKSLLFFLHAPYIGGVERFSLHVLPFLNKNNDLEVYCSLPSLATTLTKSSIKTHRLSMGKKIGGKKSFLLFLVTSPIFALQYFFVLLKHRSTHKKPIVIVQTLNEKLLISPISKLLGYKILWIDHGPLSTWIASPVVNCYRFCSRWADKIVAVSQTTKTDLVNSGVAENKITIIPNGIPTSHKFSNNPASKNTTQTIFGFLGRIIPQKGPQIILKALTLLSPESRNHSKVLIGGNGSFQEELKSFVKENKLTSFVEFLDWQESPDPFYDKIDCFINPSLYQEGFGLTIIEAWQHKLPVIASNAGGLAEIIEDENDGLLFQPGSSQELATQMQKIIEDSQLATKLGINGNNKALAQYSAETMAFAYISLLQSM